jgi:cell division inhibitor SepF
MNIIGKQMGFSDEGSESAVRGAEVFNPVEKKREYKTTYQAVKPSGQFDENYKLFDQSAYSKSSYNAEARGQEGAAAASRGRVYDTDSYLRNEKIYMRPFSALSPEDDGHIIKKRDSAVEYSSINMYHPVSFADVKELIDSVKNHDPVIVDLSKLPDSDTAIRILDFMSGAMYALSGSMQRISGNTFLFTPKGVKINNSGQNN